MIVFLCTHRSVVRNHILWQDELFVDSEQVTEVTCFGSRIDNEPQFDASGSPPHLEGGLCRASSTILVLPADIQSRVCFISQSSHGCIHVWHCVCRGMQLNKAKVRA